MTTPGIYPNMPAEEYHAIDACSSSRLKLLKRSPAHCKFSIDHPHRKQTPALVLGSAIHTMILEPEMFSSRYVIKPKFTGKGAKARREEWEAENENAVTLTDAGVETCKGMAARLYEHEKAGPILRNKSSTEIVCIWIDSVTGLLCKLRADALTDKLLMVSDLKSTTDASEYNFSRDIFKFGYQRQGAWYLDGLKACGIDYRHYCIIAQEKKEPYEPACYRLNTEGKAIELGRLENTVLKARYAECKKSGKWNGYPPVITDIELPAYAERQIEEEYQDDEY